MIKEAIITPEIDKWCESPHYHHHTKGCEVNIIGRTGAHESLVHRFRCFTCLIDTSKGGWEWGWFGGSESKLLGRVNN